MSDTCRYGEGKMNVPRGCPATLSYQNIGPADESVLFSPSNGNACLILMQH
jgi:hypothetical protein